MELATATVTPQVEGIVTEVGFREGQEVARGDVPFRIEPRPHLAVYRRGV